MKKSTLSGCLLAFLLIACGSENPAPKSARVMIIGMDGARAEALNVANTPHLDQLRADGLADLHAITGDVSLSGPGWASMLTGVWCDKHHVVDNDASWAQSQFDLYPHFMTRLEVVRPQLRTVSISHWPAINEEILCADENGDDCGQVDQVLTVSSDAAVRDAVLAELRDQDPDAIFMQFDDIDHAGHGDPETFDPGGFCPFSGGDMAEAEQSGACTPVNYNPAYLAAIETTDAYIGEILQALRARPQFSEENWLVMVSPDHGGGGTVFNQHGFPVEQDRRTFLFMLGQDVVAFPDAAQLKIVDIAATALFHLGLALDPDWDLDGQPIGLEAAPSYVEREIPSCYDPAVFVPDSRSQD